MHAPDSDGRDAALEALLVGPRAGGTPACTVVKALRLLPGGSGRLARAAECARAGDVVVYAIAIPLAFVHQLFAEALYVLVALTWLVPDRRIESRVNSASG